MKRTPWIPVLVLMLVALAIHLGTSRSPVAAELTADEMAQITGGAKHCSDEDCSAGWPCGDDAEGGKWIGVGNGTTGRQCGGSPATLCDSPQDFPCIMVSTDCNSDCTTCGTTAPTATGNECYSCN